MNELLFTPADFIPGGAGPRFVSSDGSATFNPDGEPTAYENAAQAARKHALQKLEMLAGEKRYAGFIHVRENVTWPAPGVVVVSITCGAIKA